MSAVSTTKVLSRASLDKLSSLGSDTKVHNGWRFISNRLYMSESTGSEESFVPIPDDLESVQTLLFMGFTESAAQATYSRFQRFLLDEHEEELLAFAKGTIRCGKDAIDEDDDWDEAMKSMGIDIALRKRILHPDYNQVRLTETSMYWVLQTVTDLFDFLVTLNPKLENTAISRSQSVSLASRLVLNTEESSSSRSGVTSERTPTSIATQSSSEVKATLAECLQKPGETLLFKGGAINRLQKAIVRDTIKLGNVFSIPPTDFSDQKILWYFTKQRSVAELYANWASNRLGKERVEVGIMSVVFSDDLLTESKEIYGMDYKEFVWHNRLQLPIPEKFRHYAEAEVLIGSVLDISSANVERMYSRGQNYSELQLLRLRTGDSVTQYCVQSLDLINKISDRGRLWITPLNV